MITLSSDFGTPFPAAMKGVILSRTDARLVDVGHDFPRQDVRTTAFWLREVLPWFPPAVHLVVVDPGVGTDRAPLVIRAGEHALVGPDNGVLVPAARELADGESLQPFEIGVGDPASQTFHGRDVFAPAAATVHEAGIDSMGAASSLEPVDDVVDLKFPTAEVDPGGATGEVLVVDGFGNGVTNVPGRVLQGRFGEQVTVNGDPVPVRRSYAQVPTGERVVTVGSHGNVELAVNQGRGTEAFGISARDPVAISWSG